MLANNNAITAVMVRMQQDFDPIYHTEYRTWAEQRHARILPKQNA